MARLLIAPMVVPAGQPLKAHGRRRPRPVSGRGVGALEAALTAAQPAGGMRHSGTAGSDRCRASRGGVRGRAGSDTRGNVVDGMPPATGESHDREVLGACTLDCPDMCSWVVTVREDRAIALRGDLPHPYTRGALCAKVNRYSTTLRLPTGCSTRSGASAERAREFARISWDEALDEIAARLQAIIARHGPQAIWPYQGTGSMGILQGVAGCGRRLFNVLGASQHRQTICTIAGGFGTGYTLGDNRVGMDPETFAARS